jgi:hypothetical protein
MFPNLSLDRPLAADGNAGAVPERLAIRMRVFQLNTCPVSSSTALLALLITLIPNPSPQGEGLKRQVPSPLGRGLG